MSNIASLMIDPICEVSFPDRYDNVVADHLLSISLPSRLWFSYF